MLQNEFNNLSAEEKQVVLAAPVNVAILAAIADDGEVDKREKASAIKLAHLRTFTSHELLKELYSEVDANFEINFDSTVHDIPAEFSVEEKMEFVRERLKPLPVVLEKIDRRTAELYVESLESFASHVFKAHSNVLNVFLLPTIRLDFNGDLFEKK